MKKLLSLLSVLTISGSAIPTTIAASSYQKLTSSKNSGFIINNNFSLIVKNKSKMWSNTYNSDYKNVKLFNFSKYAKDFDDFTSKYDSLNFWGYKEIFGTYVYSESPYIYEKCEEWNTLNFWTQEIKHNLNKYINHKYCKNSDDWPHISKFNSYYYFYIVNKTELWMNYSAELENYFGAATVAEDTISMSFKGIIVK